MAQGYYNIEKTAEVLGVNPADVHTMREQNELRGFRDGADWKFKAEEVEKKLAELIRSRSSASKPEEEDEEEDVLLSELELGESSVTSGSVIGGPKKDAAGDEESDLRLVDSSPGAAASDNDVTMAADMYDLDQDATVTDEDVKPASQSGVLDEIDLTLDDDATLEDSQVAVDKLKKGSSGSGGSGFDLSEALDDDNLVIGGSSGSGSDITIGGDSGISLVDPADSGLSLEEPLNLLDAGEESLELGEDDMLVFGEEEADSESPTELKTDDDFLLTPMGDVDEDDSESGSQVIALDTDSGEDEAATLVAGAGGGEMAAMLDEDFSPDAGPQFAVTPVAGQMPGASPTMPTPGMEAGPVVSLPEAPYSVLNILALSACVLLLAVTGMMLYDLLRNMWGWNGTYAVNSSLMDMITGIFK